MNSIFANKNVCAVHAIASQAPSWAPYGLLQPSRNFCVMHLSIASQVGRRGRTSVNSPYGLSRTAIRLWARDPLLYVSLLGLRSFPIRALCPGFSFIWVPPWVYMDPPRALGLGPSLTLVLPGPWTQDPHLYGVPLGTGPGSLTYMDPAWARDLR